MDDTDRHTETHRLAYTDTHINENKLKKKNKFVYGEIFIL